MDPNMTLDLHIFISLDFRQRELVRASEPSSVYFPPWSEIFVVTASINPSGKKRHTSHVSLFSGFPRHCPHFFRIQYNANGKKQNFQKKIDISSALTTDSRWRKLIKETWSKYGLGRRLPKTSKPRPETELWNSCVVCSSRDVHHVCTSLMKSPKVEAAR